MYTPEPKQATVCKTSITSTRILQSDYPVSLRKLIRITTFDTVAMVIVSTTTAIPKFYYNLLRLR